MPCQVGWLPSAVDCLGLNLEPNRPFALLAGRNKKPAIVYPVESSSGQLFNILIITIIKPLLSAEYEQW